MPRTRTNRTNQTPAEAPAIIEAPTQEELFTPEPETTYTCRDCEGEFTESEGNKDENLCESCLDSYFTCGWCEELTDNDQSNATDTGYSTVCDDCFQSRFRTCSACNDAYRRTDMTYSDQREEWFCSNCYDNNPDMPDDEDDPDDYDRSSSSPNVHSYGHSPDNLIFYGDKGIEEARTLKYKTVKSVNWNGNTENHERPYYVYNKTRFLGVELECNSHDVDSDSAYTLETLNGTLSGSGKESHAYLKEDSSIGGGFEIVTHPHTLKAHRALWEKFFASMPRYGMTSYKSGHCGMHVHVSRSSLQQFQRRRIIVFLNAPENKTYIEIIAQRGSNTYSILNPNKKIQYHLSDDRYEAYNTSNSETDEFRLFRGTTRKDRFFKNLEFVDAVLDFCLETNYPELKVKNFLAWVTKRANKYRYLHNFHIEKGYASGTPLKHSQVAPPQHVADTAA